MKSIRILASLLVLSLFGLAGMGVWIAQLQEKHKNELADVKEAGQRALSKLEEQNRAAFAAQQEQHQKAILAINEEYEKKLDSLRKDERTKMASAFTEFQSIFDGNKKTIDYINALESKVKGGQAVSKGEVEKFAVIATGLGYLQKQYQKPFEEFKELENYLSKQASLSQEKPSSSFGFFKRMFDKDYRAAERDYERKEGTRQAFVEAKAKFGTVYASARRQMAGVNINAEAYTKKLYALMEDKQQANAEDLSQFFDQARKALRTHQEVLDFQPDRAPDLPVKPQP